MSSGYASSYKEGMDHRTPIDDATWERLVKNLLRAEMMRRGVSYETLAQRLADVGVTDNAQNLRNKVARGRFTAPFFAQCMVALGVELLQIPSVDKVANASGEHGAQALAQKDTQA